MERTSPVGRRRGTLARARSSTLSGWLLFIVPVTVATEMLTRRPSVSVWPHAGIAGQAITWCALLIAGRLFWLTAETLAGRVRTWWMRPNDLT